MVGTIIKPKLGLQPKPFGEACYAFWQGGDFSMFGWASTWHMRIQSLWRPIITDSSAQVLQVGWGYDDVVAQFDYGSLSCALLPRQGRHSEAICRE